MRAVVGRSTTRISWASS
ncbi:hypothetical protein LINPERPRIM_LOCUS32591 [Linum perenne]